MLALSDSGRQGEASAALERQLAQEPDDATAEQELGLVELRRGRWSAALQRSRRALDLNPRLLDALWNLGTKGAEHGRKEAARRALARFVAQAPPEGYADDLRKAAALLRQLGDAP